MIQGGIIKVNKKTAILIGVIILVLTSIITPFFIRKLNKKVEETQKVQEEQEVQEPVETTNTEEVLKESEEQASGEQLTEEIKLKVKLRRMKKSKNSLKLMNLKCKAQSLKVLCKVQQQMRLQMKNNLLKKRRTLYLKYRI